MEVISNDYYVWHDDLENAKTNKFRTMKTDMEYELNTFYFNHGIMRASNYQRSLVLKFEKGSAIAGDPESRHHVRITVEHQLSGNTNMSLLEFEVIHPGWLADVNVNGILTTSFHVGLPTTVSGE